MIRITEMMTSEGKPDIEEVLAVTYRQEQTQHNLCYICDASLELEPRNRRGSVIYEVATECFVLVCTSCDPEYVPDEVKSTPHEELDDLVVDMVTKDPEESYSKIIWKGILSASRMASVRQE